LKEGVELEFKTAKRAAIVGRVWCVVPPEGGMMIGIAGSKGLPASTTEFS